MAEFDKPHIDISARAVRRDYQAPRRNMGGGAAPRMRAQHGARIRAELDAAFVEADDNRTEDDRIDPPEGTYVEVALRPGSNPETVLDRKSVGIRTGAVVRTEGDALQNDNQTTVALYVPDSARAILRQIIQEYTEGDLTATGNIPRKDKVEPIEAIRQARLVNRPGIAGGPNS
jgi:hypothetical protein